MKRSFRVVQQRLLQLTLRLYLNNPKLMNAYRKLRAQNKPLALLVQFMLNTKPKSFSDSGTYQCINQMKSHDHLILENVKLTGRSRFVNQNDSKYVIDIPAKTSAGEAILDTYFLQEEVIDICQVEPANGIVRFHSQETQLDLYGKWVTGLHPSSENWMHFISEVLPNLLALTNRLQDQTYGLLLDSCIAKSGRHLLNSIFPEIPKIFIDYGQVVRVEKLAFDCSETNNYSFFWPRTDQKVLGHYSFNAGNLQEVRNQILKAYAGVNMGEQIGLPTKLYIKRKSYFRNITNEGELEQKLVEAGFKIFTPTENNLVEQIVLFHSATHVVAQAGASLANMMFMQENSKVLSMSANSEWVDYAYFEEYANIFNLDFQVHLGKAPNSTKEKVSLTGSKHHPMNSDFSINADEVIEWTNI